MSTLRGLKILGCIVPVLLGMLTGRFPFNESIASAAAPIININPSTDVPTPYWGFDEGHGDGMVGWSFQLLEPFIVTQVGWYAESADGLSRPFQVGLWEGAGSSLIGDLVNGLMIPAGTNAAQLGPWRIADLAEPLILQPGSYVLGGLDTSATTDVIKYVFAGNPGSQVLAPSGSPLVIGEFFYGAMPGTAPKFGPPTAYYLAWGLELGPMLFGARPAALPTASGLNILRVGLAAPLGTGVLLTWSTGTLQQADVPPGPYTAVTNATSPYITPSLSVRKFYRLGP